MITARDKARAADRELKQRQRVYPRLVASGKMTAQFADWQIKVMASIAEDYEASASAEEQKGRLL